MPLGLSTRVAVSLENMNLTTPMIRTITLAVMSMPRMPATKDCNPDGTHE